MTLRCLLFPILLLSAAVAHADAPTHRWRGVARIVAVGDVHGDHAQLVRTLRAAGVIDDKDRWSAGKTHLVQTGDVFDRGPDSRKALDLLMRLETEAARAGGAVHALIGNHEAMVMGGDWRYVHPGELKAFGGAEGYRAALAPTGRYGRWLRTHDAVVQVNDALFVHGGLTAGYATMPLARLNAGIRQGLRGYSGMVRDGKGPLWYRGLARGSGEALLRELEPLWKTHGARHIVMGHCVQKTITVKAGGRVILIDVGMSKAYGGPAACLLIEDGVFFAVTAGKPRVRLEVPVAVKR